MTQCFHCRGWVRSVVEVVGNHAVLPKKRKKEKETVTKTNYVVLLETDSRVLYIHSNPAELIKKN